MLTNFFEAEISAENVGTLGSCKNLKNGSNSKVKVVLES
jgi:hypothetical protein